MRPYTLITLAILSLACEQRADTSTTSEAKTYSAKSDYEVVDVVEDDKPESEDAWAAFAREELSGAEQVAYDFMNWYLEVYNSDTVKFEFWAREMNGSIAINDYHFRSKLKKLGLCSESFVKGELERVQRCNEALARLKPPIDGNPAEETGGDSCDFLLYYEWIGGQGEYFTKCAVAESKKAKNTDNKEVQDVWIAVGNEIPYTKTWITCAKYDDVWLIDDVSFAGWIE